MVWPRPSWPGALPDAQAALGGMRRDRSRKRGILAQTLREEERRWHIVYYARRPSRWHINTPMVGLSILPRHYSRPLPGKSGSTEAAVRSMLLTCPFTGRCLWASSFHAPSTMSWRPCRPVGSVVSRFWGVAVGP